MEISKDILSGLNPYPINSYIHQDEQFLIEEINRYGLVYGFDRIVEIVKAIQELRSNPEKVAESKEEVETYWYNDDDY